MIRPGRLPPAERIQQQRSNRVETRRHGQAGGDDQGQGHEQDRGVGKLLQDVVIRRVMVTLAGVVCDVTRQSAQIGPRRYQLVQMAIQGRARQLDRQRDHQDPSKEEMDHPPGCKASIRRDRQSGGQGAGFAVGGPQNAGGIKLHPEDPGDAL